MIYLLQSNYTQTWLLSPWLVSTRHFENLFSVTISKFLRDLWRAIEFLGNFKGKTMTQGGGGV
jgi:hypothetical protein